MRKMDLMKNPGLVKEYTGTETVYGKDCLRAAVRAMNKPVQQRALYPIGSISCALANALLRLFTHSLLPPSCRSFEHTVSAAVCTWPLCYNAQPGRWLAHEYHNDTLSGS